LPSIPRPQAAEAALPILLRQLRLGRIRSHWQSIASQAEAEGWSPSQFLYALCEQEVEQRQQARQQRLLRAAHLPWAKALADYDHAPTVSKVVPSVRTVNQGANRRP
jgi:DNA replication protein DnaC